MSKEFVEGVEGKAVAEASHLLEEFIPLVAGDGPCLDRVDQDADAARDGDAGGTSAPPGSPVIGGQRPAPADCDGEACRLAGPEALAVITVQRCLAPGLGRHQAELTLAHPLPDGDLQTSSLQFVVDLCGDAERGREELRRRGRQPTLRKLLRTVVSRRRDVPPSASSGGDGGILAGLGRGLGAEERRDALLPKKIQGASRVGSGEFC